MQTKEIIAKNITELRKAFGYTQQELADKLNYSDKTISKWERGESTPDVDNLVNLSKIFNVSIEYFFKEESDASEVIDPYKNEMIKKVIMLALLITSIFLVALIMFVYAKSSKVVNSDNYWISFIWATFVSSFSALVFTYKKKFKKIIPILLSLTLWVLLTSIFLTALISGHNVWMLYLVGVPIQIDIILAYWIKKLK